MRIVIYGCVNSPFGTFVVSSFDLRLKPVGMQLVFGYVYEILTKAPKTSGNIKNFEKLGSA